jgi:hypothetical protein
LTLPFASLLVAVPFIVEDIRDRCPTAGLDKPTGMLLMDAFGDTVDDGIVVIVVVEYGLTGVVMDEVGTIDVVPLPI